ncbi:MAG: S1C family serine protease [Burkholderiaceae bacterium]
MRRPALYSSSVRPGLGGRTDARDDAGAGAAGNAPPAAPLTRRAKVAAAVRQWLRGPRGLWSAVGLLALLWAITMALTLQPGPRVFTQDDIDAAVIKTMQTVPLPSQAAKAYEKIQPSVVRVTAYVRKSRLPASKAEAHAGRNKDEQKAERKAEARPPAVPGTPGAPGAPGTAKAAEDEEVELGVGTGVVIVDKGIILTNLHVVQGADRIVVTFSDGLESPAILTGAQPENDLAVLQASKIPDDLFAATMRSTQNLAPGEQVLAVGFPFGIGPSASAGIVSGLKRSFRSPEGGHEMSNLIQFDAAANPGNSGGPLVTMEGEVVGIITAILNPTSARTFIGIGFAVPIENAASAVGLSPF